MSIPPDIEQSLHDELRLRLQDPPPIPQGFDSENVSQDELRRLRLPPRPDPQRDPELYKLWTRMFSPPVTFLPLTLEAALRIRLELPVRHTLPRCSPSNSGVAAGLPGRSRVGGSRNWTGPVVLANRGDRFGVVAGSWRAPAALLPPVPSQTVNGEYRASVWVGVDGYRRFTQGMPQIGTTHAVTIMGAPVQPGAWFQWWARDQNLPFFPLPFPPVAPGNEMIAIVAALTPALGVMLLKNQTAPGGPLVIVLMTAPVGVGGAAVEIAGATAEWILERPTQLGTNALYALPDIKQTMFEACLAELQFAPAPPPSPARTRRLVGVRLVRMLEQRPGPWRSVVIAPAQKDSVTSATVVYRGP